MLDCLVWRNGVSDYQFHSVKAALRGASLKSTVVPFRSTFKRQGHALVFLSLAPFITSQTKMYPTVE